MIPNVKASLIMNYIVDTAKIHLKKLGTMNGQLFFLRKKNGRNPLIQIHETLFYRDANVIVDQTPVDMTDKQFGLNLEGVLYLLQSQSLKEDKIINQFIREFMSYNDVDMVVFVMVGYRKKVEEKDRGKKDLSLDIDSTRVLHATYGLRGTKELYTMTTPLVEAGNKRPTEENPVDIHTVLTPWEICSDENFSRLEVVANKNGGSLWN